jgi:hypothetical protein
MSNKTNETSGNTANPPGFARRTWDGFTNYLDENPHKTAFAVCTAGAMAAPAVSRAVSAGVKAVRGAFVREVGETTKEATGEAARGFFGGAVRSAFGR